MTREQELFGAALMLARRHGREAVVLAAARVEEHLQTGEDDAATLWKAIAARIPLALDRVAAQPS